MNPEALTAMLGAYAPGDDREREYRARMLQLSVAARPFDRKAFGPGHFTASAFVVPPERDALLLILHHKLGIWLQPGGHVDPNDASIGEAARREVCEEVGIFELAPLRGDEHIFDLDIHRIPAHRDEPEHEHFDVRFAFAAPTRAFAVTDEVAAARWVPFPEIAQVTADASVLRAARKLTSVR